MKLLEWFVWWMGNLCKLMNLDYWWKFDFDDIGVRLDVWMLKFYERVRLDYVINYFMSFGWGWLRLCFWDV